MLDIHHRQAWFSKSGQLDQFQCRLKTRFGQFVFAAFSDVTLKQTGKFQVIQLRADWISAETAVESDSKSVCVKICNHLKRDEACSLHQLKNQLNLMTFIPFSSKEKTSFNTSESNNLQVKEKQCEISWFPLKCNNYHTKILCQTQRPTWEKPSKKTENDQDKKRMWPPAAGLVGICDVLLQVLIMWWGLSPFISGETTAAGLYVLDSQRSHTREREEEAEVVLLEASYSQTDERFIFSICLLQTKPHK